MPRNRRGRPRGSAEPNAAHHRFNLILRALSAPGGADLDELEDFLKMENLAVGPRQIRKTLESLQNDPRVEIELQDSERPYRWKLADMAFRQKASHLNIEEALKIAVLGETSVSRILPRFIRKVLEEEVQQAESWLSRRSKVEQRAQWSQRVILRRPQFRHSIDRAEPEVDEEVERLVHQALLERLPLRVSYFSGHLNKQLGEFTIYPIGLDCQLQWITLVAQLDRKDRNKLKKISEKYGDDYVQLPLHRIASASLIEFGHLPSGFDSRFTMERYIAGYEPDRPRGGPNDTEGIEMELVAIVKEGHASDLRDSPLRASSGHQELAELGQGQYCLRIKVIETEMLLRWCAALCDCMAIEEPIEFKDKVDSFLKYRTLPYV